MLSIRGRARLLKRGLVVVLHGETATQRADRMVC